MLLNGFCDNRLKAIKQAKTGFLRGDYLHGFMWG
jgi:hypothetical protein